MEAYQLSDEERVELALINGGLRVIMRRWENSLIATNHWCVGCG